MPQRRRRCHVRQSRHSLPSFPPTSSSTSSSPSPPPSPSSPRWTMSSPPSPRRCSSLTSLPFSIRHPASFLAPSPRPRRSTFSRPHRSEAKCRERRQSPSASGTLTNYVTGDLERYDAHVNAPLSARRPAKTSPSFDVDVIRSRSRKNGCAIAIVAAHGASTKRPTSTRATATAAMISAVIVPLASEQQPPAHEKSDKVNCCISTQTFTFLGALRLSKFFWWCVGVFWCEST